MLKCLIGSIFIIETCNTERNEKPTLLSSKFRFPIYKRITRPFEHPFNIFLFCENVLLYSYTIKPT